MPPRKKKDEDIPKDVGSMMNTAESVLEQNREESPPTSDDASQKGVRVLKIGEEEPMDIEDYAYSISIEIKKELRPGMNLKVGRLELFRPSETVKVWTTMNFDRRKQTHRDAFDWLLDKLQEEVDTIPVYSVRDAVAEAREVEASAPTPTPTRPPQPPPRRAPPRRVNTTPVPDLTGDEMYRDFHAFIRQSPRAPSDWRPKSPFQASNKSYTSGFYSCAESQMEDSGEEADQIKAGELAWAYYNAPSGQYAGRFWYHG